MRLGLIGDIHAEDERLEAALQIFRRESVDRVLFVGDVVDGYGDLDRCCALLAPDAIGVRGNHDRWMLDDKMRSLPRAHSRHEIARASLAFLEALPATRDIDTPRGTLLLCHGVGPNDMQRLWTHDEGYALETNDPLSLLLQANHHAIVVGGHTHARMVRRFRASDLRIEGDAALVFINPGTLARDHTPCCAVLDFDAEHVRYFELEDPADPLPSETIALP